MRDVFPFQMVDCVLWYNFMVGIACYTLKISSRFFIFKIFHLYIINLRNYNTKWMTTLCAVSIVALSA